MTQRFWPVAEPAQTDCETLREAILHGDPLQTLAAARFARHGLAGLIVWPEAEPAYAATVLGARRPPWTPEVDPRLEALAAGFELILNLRAEHRELRRRDDEGCNPCEGFDRSAAGARHHRSATRIAA